MSSSNLNLVEAFPSAVRADALVAISALPEVSTTSYSFSVSVGPETLTIPYRIYHDVTLIQSRELTETQGGLLSCLLTRHHDGFVREQHLRKILGSMDAWIPPFVVQLVGEYVVEMIGEVREGLDRLNPDPYGSFLRQNPAFYQLIPNSSNSELRATGTATPTDKKKRNMQDSESWKPLIGSPHNLQVLGRTTPAKSHLRQLQFSVVVNRATRSLTRSQVFF
jgi:hypothetical protein